MLLELEWRRPGTFTRSRTRASVGSTPRISSYYENSLYNV
jgi:hypothetical protein